jgi:hypothetical protein
MGIMSVIVTILWTFRLYCIRISGKHCKESDFLGVTAVEDESEGGHLVIERGIGWEG